MSIMTEAEELTNVSIDHGLNGYKNGACRGPICKAANAEATRNKRAERREQGVPLDVHHGASCYTNWGCRCEICRAGHAEETSRYK